MYAKYQILDYIGLVVLEKKTLTHDGRRTSQYVDEGRQPIAIGHPSDSGDLIIRVMIYRAGAHNIYRKKVFFTNSTENS